VDTGADRDWFTAIEVFSTCMADAALHPCSEARQTSVILLAGDPFRPFVRYKKPAWGINERT
jgi:hypothetical protein